MRRSSAKGANVRIISNRAISLPFDYEKHSQVWDSGAVVYHPLSGDTFRLSSEADRLLRMVVSKRKVRLLDLLVELGLQLNSEDAESILKLIANLRRKHLVVEH